MNRNKGNVILSQFCMGTNLVLDVGVGGTFCKIFISSNPQCYRQSVDFQVEDLGTELKSLKDQLRVAEGAASREVEAASEMRRDFEIQMGNLETEVDKWKVLHESLYLQVYS